MQTGVIKNLASFLRLLSYSCRVAYLPLLHDILHSSNPFHWRLRQLIALQLSELMGMCTVESVFELLFPLVMTLLQDPVAAVRKASYRGVATLLIMLHSKRTENGLGELSQQFNSVVFSINAFVSAENYLSRQLWVELCHCFLLCLSRDAIQTHFLDGIVRLSLDPVINVRISVASLLAGWSNLGVSPVWALGAPLPRESGNNWLWLFDLEEIKSVVKSLADDDRDVYDCMIKLQPVFPEISFAVFSQKAAKSNKAFGKDGRLSTDELISVLRKSLDRLGSSRLHELPPLPPHSAAALDPLAPPPNIDGLPEDLYSEEKLHLTAAAAGIKGD